MGVHKTCIPCPEGNTTMETGAKSIDVCDIRQFFLKFENLK